MPSRLARGVRVGNRYRLERELGPGTDGVTWEAVDERLDRPVALRIFDASLDRRTIVQRAGIAASLTHPRVVRVFDTGEDAGRFFTVSELVSESLQTVRLPLGPDTALQTAIDIAEALQYAHERGVVHGNLNEGNILIAEGGAKVGDFALSRPSEHADRDDDLRSLGALMRRVAGLPDQSAPPGFSAVIEGLAAGAYTSAADALRDLRALLPSPAEPRPARSRRGWLVIVVAILLGLIAFGAMRLGEQSPRQELLPGGRIEGTPLEVASADDLDPPPGDGREGAGTVGNAIDRDAATFWSTETYSGSADFNGKKEGVGLVLDLGEAKEIGRARVLWVAQGCSFELRYSDTPAAPVAEWGEAATITNSPISAPLRFEANEARYWLLWITRLTASGSGYQCRVKEAELFAPEG
jgi:serine/threonine protein kinase